jgi:hypothetical protein
LAPAPIRRTELRTYPKYRRVRGAALAEIAVLLPTFQGPSLDRPVSDDDAIAMARVVDLVEHENDTSSIWRSLRAPRRILRGHRTRGGHIRLTKGAS